LEADPGERVGQVGVHEPSRQPVLGPASMVKRRPLGPEGSEPPSAARTQLRAERPAGVVPRRRVARHLRLCLGGGAGLEEASSDPALSSGIGEQDFHACLPVGAPV